MADSEIRRSNCLGRHSIVYPVEGISIRATVPDYPSQNPARFGLHVSLSVGAGKKVKFLRPNVSITTLADNVTSAIGIPSIIQAPVDYRNMQFQKGYRIPDNLKFGALDTLEGAERIFAGRVIPRSFSFALPMESFIEKDFRVILPTLDIDGKHVNIPPITFTRTRRMEVFTPLNC